MTTYNYAVDAAQGGTIGMQAGSVFKAFTLAAAFERASVRVSTSTHPRSEPSPRRLGMR